MKQIDLKPQFSEIPHRLHIGDTVIYINHNYRGDEPRTLKLGAGYIVSDIAEEGIRVEDGEERPFLRHDEYAIL